MISFDILSIIKLKNKELSDGRVESCKKTTRRHAHLSLLAKSRKTNDVE